MHLRMPSIDHGVVSFVIALMIAVLWWVFMVGVGEQVVLELSDADPQPVHALDDAGNGLEVFGGGGGVDPHWTKKIRRAGDAFVHRAD